MLKSNIFKKKFAVITSFLVILGILGGVFAGCNKSQNPENPQSSGNDRPSAAVYTVADPTGDWGYPTMYSAYQRGPGYIRMTLIFDTLIWKDEKGFVPALAEKWEYIKEENAYLFELNKKAKWHDGKNVTSSDVKFTYDYIKKHPYSWIDSSKIKDVKVIDDYKLKIYLNMPYAPFLNNIAGVLPILPEHIWSKIDKPEEFRGSEAVIGSGPFKLADYNKEQGTYLYEANHDYYLGAPKVEKLKFVKVSKEMIGTALQRNEIDYGQIPPDLKDKMADGDLEVIKVAHDWALKLIINHQKEPLSNKEFRQAFAYAINREELVEVTQRGHALAGSQGLLASDAEWYNPDVMQYKYNPDKSKEILKGLGYVLKDKYFTKEGKQLSFDMLITPEYERDGQFIKGQLEEIGIKINLVSLESKTLDSRLDSWNFDLALAGHGGLGGDYESLNKFIAGKSFLSARYNKNKTLLDLIKKQTTILEPEERKAVVDKIQGIYSQDVPCITLYYPDWYYCYSKTIKHFNTYQGVGFGVPIPFNKMSFIK